MVSHGHGPPPNLYTSTTHPLSKTEYDGGQPLRDSGCPPYLIPTEKAGSAVDERASAREKRMSDDFDDVSHVGHASDTGGTSEAVAGEGDSQQVPWPLWRATARWLRRGYTVRYSDAFLVQLVRRASMGWVGWALLVLALPCLGVAFWLIARALRRRGWHVVSLTITPDGRVISHRQWTRAEPT